MLPLVRSNYLRLRYCYNLNKSISNINQFKSFNHLNQNNLNQFNQIRNFSYDPIQFLINVNIAIRNSPIIDHIQKSLIQIHESLNIPWNIEIVLVALILRGVMLSTTIYERRLNAKTDRLAPEMNKDVSKLIELTKRKLQLREFRNEIQAELWFKRERKKIYKQFYLKHNLSPAKRIIILLSPAPVWMSMSFSIGNLCSRTPPELLESESIKQSIEFCRPQLETEGCLWFTNLILTDPYFILPTLFSLSLLTTIEYNVLSKKMNLIEDTFKTKVITNVIRGAIVVLAYTSFYTPAGLTLYWLTNSLSSLTLNILLSKSKVRKLFKIPDTISTKDLPGAKELSIHMLNRFKNSTNKLNNYLNKFEEKLKL